MSGNYVIRALDPAERFIWLLDRISCANFVVIAEIDGDPIGDATLRAALDRLQASHPLLAARVVDEPVGTVAFHREEGSRIPLRIDRADDTDWQAAIEPEFNARFDDPALPLARCGLVRLRGRSVLNLTFHHAIGDARSGVTILKQLLRACLLGSEAARHAEAPPPLHALFPSREEWLRHPGTAEELGQQMRAEAVRHGAPDELTFLRHEERLRQPRLQTIRWPAADGRRLQDHCRAEGTSVHGAICAAHLLATHALFDGEAARTLYLMCPVDMRPGLAADMSEQLSYCTTFLRSTYRIEAQAPLWPLAREIGGDMKARMARGDGHLAYSGLPLDRIGGRGPGFDAFAAEVDRLPGGSNISNIGRVATLDDCPQVTAISFALCSLPKHLASLNVSSYRDELTVNMTWDAVKLAPDLADRLAGRLKAIIDQAVRAEAANPAR